LFLQKFKVVLPHLGLALSSIIYVMMGGVLFCFTEGPYEIESLRLSALQSKRWKREMFDSGFLLEDFRSVHLNEFTRSMFELFDEPYVNLTWDVENSPQLKWTISHGVFFTVTTLTTIGYGNLAPVTRLGRVLCSIYGMIGIPLLLVTTADWGSFIGAFVGGTQSSSRISRKHTLVLGVRGVPPPQLSKKVERVVRVHFYEKQGFFGIFRKVGFFQVFKHFLKIFPKTRF